LRFSTPHLSSPAPSLAKSDCYIRYRETRHPRRETPQWKSTCPSLCMRTAILFFLPTLLAAQQNFEFTGRYWIPHMNTRIRVESAGLGTDIDARADLGIRDTNFPEAPFTWHHART